MSSFSPQEAVVTQLGAWKYSELAHFFGDLALLCVPMCYHWNTISIFRSAQTEDREVKRRLNLKMCVVCSQEHILVSLPVSLEGDRNKSWRTKLCAGEWLGSELRQWETSVRDKWTGRHTQSVSITNHLTHVCAARVTWKQCSVYSVLAGAKCVCLLSKWSCLCLKLDCRLVLSLETGALISVWLCWLSFSSISTVQQEKPCGHTLSGAPAKHKKLMVFSAKKLITNIKITLNQNQPVTKFDYVLGETPLCLTTD